MCEKADIEPHLPPIASQIGWWDAATASEVCVELVLEQLQRVWDDSTVIIFLREWWCFHQ
jgi:hypothetical protein